MKHTMMRAVMALTVAFGAGSTNAADLPAPAFYVKGDRLEAGVVKADVPAGSGGLVEGTVTSDGEALVFDGSGGMVVFDFDAQNLFASPFTISARVETIATNGYGDILTAAQPVGIGLRTGDHGNYCVSGGGAGAWNVVTSAAKSLRVGSFQHVAVTYDGADVVVYVDGMESGRGQLKDGPRSGNKIMIGGMGRPNPSGSGKVDAPNSRLSHIAVFDSVLTEEQIAGLAGGLEIPVQ